MPREYYAALAVGVLWLRHNAYELSATATGLPNDPPLENWIPLAVLRWKMRTLPDGTTWTSADRNDDVNAAVGGVARSKHRSGHALDVVPPPGWTTARLATACRASGVWSLVLDEDDHVHLED